MISFEEPRRFFFWDELQNLDFFRLEQIRIGGKKPVGGSKNQQENMSQTSDAGPLSAAFLPKIWGPGGQTQLSRCSNTAFAPRLDHFFLGTANLPMRCTLYHWKYPKKKTVMKGATISFAILDFFAPRSQGIWD